MINVQRDNKIDIIRGFGMILVIFGHALELLVDKGFLEISTWGRIYDVVYAFHMPLFFCVSGYLYKGENNEKIGTIIWKNIVSLYIPYLILNYLYWFERIAAKELFGMQLDNNVALFSIKECIRLTYSGEGLTWFLLSLLLVKIIFSIIHRFSSYITCGVFFSIMFWAAFFFPEYRFFEFLAWGFFFFVGFILRQQTINGDNRIIIYILNAALLISGIIRYMEIGLDNIVKLMIGISVFIYCIINSKYIPNFRVLECCGRYSLVIYMIHGLSQYVCCFLGSNIMGIKNGVFMLFFMIVLQVFFALLIVECFSKVEWLGWMQFFFYPYNYIRKRYK